MNRERMITIFERFLKVRFPEVYRQFLLDKAPTTIGPFYLFGLPEIEEEPIEEDFSFKKWLVERLMELKKEKEGKFEKGDFKIGEIEIEEEPSVLQATQILRTIRSDLPKSLIAISFHPFKDKVLCLDLEREKEGDCPLVETTLKEKTKLIPISDSFGKWLKETEEKEKTKVRFLATRRRIENRRNEIREREINRMFGSKCPVYQRN